MASISRARNASVTNMESALPHGGDLGAARRLFPDAPEPFIDLSTGINPHSYPVPQLSSDVAEVRDPRRLRDADLAVVVNPNNPDGRIFDRDALRDLADAQKRRGGLLVVDEAFMDVGPLGDSLCGDVATHNVVVLRSFGKF